MAYVDAFLGYPIPFPKEDLIVALVAVTVFIPAVIVAHFILSRIFRPFFKPKKQ
jgi:hypothetical protein